MNFIKRLDLPESSDNLIILMPDGKEYFGFLSATERFYIIKLTETYHDVPLEGIVSWDYGFMNSEGKIVRGNK